MDAKVHIAFGFHVNLYHSFRGDSNDDRGFGPDIRIIRNTIKVLDGCNSRGIPVRGTWDFENAYSLENILPVHAPDIIEDVARRTGTRGDEMLLMSYNNGLVSCMNEKEFTVSTEWALSNPFRSGIRDIFGTCAPVVRPQEMMFSPSNIRLYKQLGTEALCLYYSGVPFDSFRTLIPLLPEGYAYNPLWYGYRGEKLAIIPAISHSDLVDYGCLGSLVKRLRKKQLSGDISGDVLVFINMDADAPLWYGLKLPFPLGRLPNTRGLEGLIGEISDLDYVVFDTPYNYLKSHPPAAEISFNQDTADGVFDGYASWAEKPFNHLIWTRIERARLLDEKCRWLANLTTGRTKPKEMQRLLDMAFYDRLCLMSTTHFGLAAPMINRDREIKALETSRRMLENADKAWQGIRGAWLAESPLPLAAPDGGEMKPRAVIPFIISEKEYNTPFISMSVNLKKGLAFDTGRFFLCDRCGEQVAGAFLDTARHEDGSLAEIRVFAFLSGKSPCRLDLIIAENECTKPYNPNLFVNENRLSGESLEVVCDGTAVAEVRAFGKRIGGRDFFKSYIKYLYGVVGAEYGFITERRELLRPGRGGKLAGYRFHGRIDLPGQVRNGNFTMDLFIVDGIPALMVRMDIRYPYTSENALISNEVAVLGHYCDSNWIEAAPLQIKPMFSEAVSIVKYNYQGDLSSYDVADFEKADPSNAEMDSFNNHITAGFVGATDGNTGVIVATDRSRLSSMAFCPMRSYRTEAGPSVFFNPFGTYFGRQRHHKTYSGGFAQKLAVAASPYHRSLAPAYNGVRTGFLLGIFPFRGKMPESDTFDRVKAFCDGGVYFSPPNEFTSEQQKEYVELHRPDKRDGRYDQGRDEIRSLAEGIPLRLRLKVIWNMAKTWFLSI
jgi:hypothetical protein